MSLRTTQNLEYASDYISNTADIITHFKNCDNTQYLVTNVLPDTLYCS